MTFWRWCSLHGTHYCVFPFMSTHTGLACSVNYSDAVRLCINWCSVCINLLCYSIRLSCQLNSWLSLNNVVCVCACVRACVCEHEYRGKMFLRMKLCVISCSDLLRITMISCQWDQWGAPTVAIRATEPFLCCCCVFSGCLFLSYMQVNGPSLCDVWLLSLSFPSAFST